MRGFISRVCFSRGRMAGPLLASGVCSEQEEGKLRVRVVPAKPLSSVSAAGLRLACLGPPGRALGGGKGVHCVSQLASVPREFFFPLLFFQICSDEHRLYNETT